MANLSPGTNKALLTIHGSRLGIMPGMPGNAALILDGNIIASPNATDTEIHTNMQMQPNTYLYESVNSALTALAGGGQTGATLLNAELNYVTTATTNVDSLMLPVAVKGMTVTVANKSGFANAVYPNSADNAGAGGTIDGQAANVSITQMVNSTTVYFCPVAGVWTTNGAGEGYSGGLMTNSASSALTALAGGAYSSLTPQLANTYNLLSVVATTSDCVMLPSSAVGLAVTVLNEGAATAAIFPFFGSTDHINVLSSATSYPLASSHVSEFICNVVGKWRSISATTS